MTSQLSTAAVSSKFTSNAAYVFAISSQSSYCKFGACTNPVLLQFCAWCSAYDGMARYLIVLISLQ